LGPESDAPENVPAPAHMIISFQF